MTTPFGQKVREMRHETGTTLKDLADALGVSQAYLSALETGRRPRPTPARVDQICAYFGIIWDEAVSTNPTAGCKNGAPPVGHYGIGFQKNRLARTGTRMAVVRPFRPMATAAKTPAIWLT